jgi:hypothetical protein
MQRARAQAAANRSTAGALTQTAARAARAASASFTSGWGHELARRPWGRGFGAQRGRTTEAPCQQWLSTSKRRRRAQPKRRRARSGPHDDGNEDSPQRNVARFFASGTMRRRGFSWKKPFLSLSSLIWLPPRQKTRTRRYIKCYRNYVWWSIGTNRTSTEPCELDERQTVTARED